MAMTLREAIKSVAWENQEYFKWKFPDARFDQTIELRTEEEFLNLTKRKTMNGFFDWEKTPEYSNLVALYLQSKVMNDIYEIYNVVRLKALEGDEKSVKLLLQLNKEINAIVKASSSIRNVEEVDDGLVL